MAQTTYIIRLRDRVTKQAQRMQKSINRTERSAKRLGNTLDFVGRISAAVAVGGIFKFGAELEQAKLKFNTLTGSVEKGTKLFNDLRDFANTTPFQDNRLQKNASTLLAFGNNSKTVIKTLRMLGDVAAGDQHRLDALTLAFAQSQAAGRLLGQDLLQFVNAGFNPLQIIAKKTGKEMLDLKKMMEKGLVPFKLIRKAFEAATSKGGDFYRFTQKMSTTMAGRWSTAMGKGKAAIGELGLVLKPIFLKFINNAIKAIDRIRDFIDGNKELIRTIAKLTIKIGGTILALKGLRFAFFGAWTAIKKNPIGLLIAAFVSLDTYLQKTSKGTFSIVTGLKLYWAELKFGFRTLSSFFAKTGNILSNVFKGIEQGMFGNLKSAKMYFKNVKNIAQGIFKVDKTSRQQYEREVLAIMEKAKKTAIKMPSVGGVTPEFDFNFSDEMKKLQAEGVVSGKIQTFNININSLTGVGTLSTTNVTEGGAAAGQAVVDVLLKTLSDIRPI